MTVEEALDLLPEVELDALMVAFEEQRSRHVEYVEGRFVGVNIIEQKGLVVETHAGLFSEGLILGSES